MSINTKELEIPKKKQKGNWNWLIWWKIEPQELQKQVAGYNTLKFYQSARGISVLLLLFATAITTVFIFAHLAGYEAYSFIDAAIALLLCPFIYRGHKWAMLGAMTYWSFAKGYQIYNVVSAPT